LNSEPIRQQIGTISAHIISDCFYYGMTRQWNYQSIIT